MRAYGTRQGRHLERRSKSWRWMIRRIARITCEGQISKLEADAMKEPCLEGQILLVLQRQNKS